MKTIAERLRERLNYDPDTGALTWRVGTSAGPAGSSAGWNDSDGYLQVRFEGRLYQGHRLIWLYMTGGWPGGIVDHKNVKPSDNRWDNLRDVSERTNQENRRRANKNSRTGLLGVTAKGGGRFAAKIESMGRTYCLGTYATPELAHAAYVDAKRKIHEGCTL